jgi:hypothetical protein
MPDIAEQLDAAIGAAPYDAPTLEPTLALGRRNLARRRLAASGGVAVVTAVLAGSVWALGPGTSTTTAPDDSRFSGRTSADGWPHDAPAWIDPESGELLVRDGWSILERVEDPVTGTAPSDFAARTIDDSVGLVLTDGSTDQWVIVWWAAESKGDTQAGVSGSTMSRAGEDFDSFGRWLDYEAEIMTSEPGGEVWGREAAMLDPDGTLITKPGWEVAERIDDPFGEGSLAVDVTDGVEHQWFLWDGPGMEISDTHTDQAHPDSPDPDYATFAEWVAAMVDATNQPSGAGTR